MNLTNYSRPKKVRYPRLPKDFQFSKPLFTAEEFSRLCSAADSLVGKPSKKRMVKEYDPSALFPNGINWKNVEQFRGNEDV